MLNMVNFILNITEHETSFGSHYFDIEQFKIMLSLYEPRKRLITSEPVHMLASHSCIV